MPDPDPTLTEEERGHVASIIADHIRDLPRLLSPPPGEPESEKP